MEIPRLLAKPGVYLRRNRLFRRHRPQGELRRTGDHLHLPGVHLLDPLRRGGPRKRRLRVSDLVDHLRLAPLAPRRNLRNHRVRHLRLQQTRARIPHRRGVPRQQLHRHGQRDRRCRSPRNPLRGRRVHSGRIRPEGHLGRPSTAKTGTTEVRPTPRAATGTSTSPPTSGPPSPVSRCTPTAAWPNSC